MKTKNAIIPPVEIAKITDKTMMNFLVTEQGKYDILKENNRCITDLGREYVCPVSISYDGTSVSGMASLKDTIARLIYIREDLHGNYWI